MGWRKDSSWSPYIWETEPLSPAGLSERDDEIRWLVAHERQRWGLINGRLIDKADPMMYGSYAGLAAQPPDATIANVPTINGEMSPWDVPSFTPWPKGTLVAPTGWLIKVSWQLITVATPASVTINPRIGSIASGATSAGGVALGADAAITLTASITTNWWVEGMLTVGKASNRAGANSLANSQFNVTAKPATAGNGPATINDLFGYTSGAAFDSSAASGFTLGMAHTVTTINYSVQQILWVSLF